MSAVAAAQDGENGFMLAGASGVATFIIEDSPYAIVTASSNNSVSVIDLSDPTCPVVLGTAVDGEHTTLKGARGVAVFTISGGTFAIVCGRDDDGVQIINVTNPSNLVAVGSAIDGQSGSFPELKGAFGISTFAIGASTFAIVVGFDGSGPGRVQLIDVSIPSSPLAAGSATDGNDGFTALAGASGVATFAIGVFTYAIVASRGRGGEIGGGVQLINVTNPGSPQAVSAAIDEVGLWVGAVLKGARDVAIFTIDDKTFAIVASYNDKGVPSPSPTQLL